MTRRSLCASLFLIPVLLGGCRRRWFYEWRDEPYIRPVYEMGEKEALDRVRSISADDRDIGCRALAVYAGEALREGRLEKVREYASLFMDVYEREESPQVRSSIAGICLREAGPGDGRVYRFLKQRLRRLQEPAAAAYSLASLKAPGAFEEISLAFASSVDFELKYELLGALWLLGDARARRLYKETLAEIDTVWPEEIHHLPKPVYKRTLLSRLERLTGAVR